MIGHGALMIGAENGRSHIGAISGTISGVVWIGKGGVGTMGADGLER